VEQDARGIVITIGTVAGADGSGPFTLVVKEFPAGEDTKAVAAADCEGRCDVLCVVYDVADEASFEAVVGLQAQRKAATQLLVCSSGGGTDGKVVARQTFSQTPAAFCHAHGIAPPIHLHSDADADGASNFKVRVCCAHLNSVLFSSAVVFVFHGLLSLVSVKAATLVVQGSLLVRFVLLSSWFVLLSSWFVLLNSWFVLLSSWYVLLSSWFVLLSSWYVLLSSWFVLLSSWFVLLSSWFVLGFASLSHSSGDRRLKG
jgi:hypothetical protein